MNEKFNEIPAEENKQEQELIEGAEHLDELNAAIENAETPEEKESALAEAEKWEEQLNMLETELGIPTEIGNEVLVELYEGKVSLEEVLAELQNEDPELAAAVESQNLPAAKELIDTKKLGGSKLRRFVGAIMLTVMGVGALASTASAGVMGNAKDSLHAKIGGMTGGTRAEHHESFDLDTLSPEVANYNAFELLKLNTADSDLTPTERASLATVLNQAGLDNVDGNLKTFLGKALNNGSISPQIVKTVIGIAQNDLTHRGGI